MKKKIAILTQPLGSNYGGIIQNYALQKVLKDLGHEPITINRKGSEWTKAIKLWRRLKNLINVHVLNKNRLTPSDLEKITEHTQKFINENIQLSPLIENTTDLKKHFNKNDFDAVIVGSDQTWRPRYSPNIYNYYLDFLVDKEMIKLAYASSFGTERWEYTDEQAKRCRDLIPQFDAISVREKSGVDLCKNYLKADAVHLLDPTMLLTAEDYSSLIQKPKERKELYTYVLDNSHDVEEFIKNVGQKLGLTQTTNQAKAKFELSTRRKTEDYILPPIEGWLQGFRDADFVITDSFHGTVFSIINKKPFLTILNKSRGASRFESLLGQFGLEDRLLYSLDNLDYKILEKEIDFEFVHSEIDKQRKQSLEFLQNNLDN